MKRLRIGALTALAIAAPAQIGWAQTARPVDGEVLHFNLDYATGEITTPVPLADTLVSSCYDNGLTFFSGLYATQAAGDEDFDWGIKSCNLTGKACEFVFGYGTTALDPGAGGPGASLTVSFYSNYTGSCSAGSPTPTPTATYVFTSLPGSPDGVSAVAFTGTVNISSAGFILDDGAIGWSYSSSDGVSGPMLMTTTGPCGGPGDPLTGTEDCFDKHTGGTCTGTFIFLTPGIASFYMEIGEDDGSFGQGSQVQRFGTGCNVGVLDLGTLPPRIGSSWNPSISTNAVASPIADFYGISTGPGGDGCVILILDTPPNPFATDGGGVGFGSPFSISVPPNCSLIGASASIQAGQVGVGFGFTNAIDVVIGV